MKISAFTPTHNPKFINRLYSSFLEQTYKNWEWIIVPNNGVMIEPIPDERIKICPCDKSKNIGFLKNYAANMATGDILIEVDHDDELFPEAFEECFNAFQDPLIDFVYSNCCSVEENYKPRIFDSEYGWLFRPCKYKSYDLKEMLSFSPSPASISKIWYAPNHFRAWKSSFYKKIGGHDIEMDILDDQDILCRTYINGAMKHIDKPLYLYHIHAENTCYGEKNLKIQEMTLDIHDKYIYSLVEKWCDINGLRKVDICSDENKTNGYEFFDITKGFNEKWPFEDGTIGLFRAHDALQYLKPIHTMTEVYRCLAPNGWFLTQTPSTDGRGAFQDPRNISFWNSNSFWYYAYADQAKSIGTPVKFQLNRIKNFFPTDWHKCHNIVYTKADLLKFSGRTPGGFQI